MANLTPEQLAQLKQMQVGYTDPSSGMQYRSNANSGWGQDATGANAASEYYQIDPRTNTGKPGDAYKVFNADGTFNSMGKNNDQSDAMWQLAALAAIGGGAAYGGGMFGGAGAAGGGSGAATGLSSAGDAFMPGALGAGGAEVPFGSVIPGLESYVLPASAGGAAGGAAGASAGGGGGMSTAGDMFMPGQLGANGVNMSSGVLPGMEGYLAGGTGGGMGSLLSGGGSKLLGGAATLAGGLLGSKPQEQSQTSTRTMDPRLDAAYGGLLSRVDNQLNQQNPGYDQMKTVGMGLLGQPIAGNGFSKFSSR